LTTVTPRRRNDATSVSAAVVSRTRAATPPQLPPLGRYVQPAEVAALTCLLLGPDGGSITGQHLVICGGASL
jgi:NAD(P)-dependent dehydrogenase (short-subunit alcohol dehydrogenase family)